VDEELFVVAEAVEGIKDRKVFCLVSVKRWRKNDAVGNAVRKDFAGDGVAFDAACGGEEREVYEVKEGKEVKEKTEERGVGS
jgi:hypothetical protein